MSSPRHLWSGDWQRESDAAADELARRRAAGWGREEPPLEEPEPPVRPPRPVTPDRRPRRSLRDRVAAALRDARGRLAALRRPSPRQRRLATAIVVAAVLVAGAAYGLAAIGGSGGASASEVIRSSGHPWLGVQLSNPIGGGVIVDGVVPGSPADRAGIEPGDVIMQVGSQPVNSPADVTSAIANLGVGAQVQIVVLRGAMTYTTEATIVGQPAGSP